jgi:hypothetical protein
MAAIMLTREQKEVFDSMPKAWQAETKRAVEIQSKITQTGVMGRYDLGEIVAKFTKNEANYGEEAVPNLASVLGEDPNNLWQYRQFAGTYSRREVEALLERATKAGYRLTWSHFDALSGVAGKQAVVIRKNMEKACFVERLNVVDLRARIQKKMGGKRSAGGRKPNRPRSIAAGIGQMVKVAEQFDSRWEGWEEVVFEGVMNAGADQIDPDLIRTLEEGKKAQEHLRDRATAAVGEYDKALERARTVLKNVKAGEEPAPTPTAGKKVVKKVVRKIVKKPAANGHANGAAPGTKVVKKIIRKVPAAANGSVADRVQTARDKRAARPQPA